jgi:hypothetical protein
VNGEFVLPNEGTDPVVVTCRLDGRWVQITNLLDPEPILTGVAVPGVPLELRWDDGSATDAERSAYLHANRIHDLVKRYDSTWTAPDYTMPVTVNAEFTCGAFWDGTGVRLGRQGSGCANLARIGDAVYHEYAHGITQWIYGGNPPDVGEGNSDVAAVIITGDPIIAEGFFLGDCETGLRDVRDDLRYPDDYIPGQPFHNGRIISGFWWDVREGLVAHYGEEEATDVIWNVWHMSRRHFQPVTMPDQVFYAFVEDDDDGDLSNGTPHYEELCAAAETHGFECPPITSGIGGEIAETGWTLACAPSPTASSARVSFRAPGGPVTLRAYDVAGRLVRTLLDGTRAPGPHEVVWDGAGHDGRRLPGGVYLLELSAEGRQAVRRIILLN